MKNHGEQQPSRAHSPRFINITDLLSATLSEENEDFEEHVDDLSMGDLQVSGYKDIEGKDQILRNIKLTCSDCEGEKGRRTQMEEKFREMSENVQRLERKVDSLINALILTQAKRTNEEQSLVEVHVDSQKNTNDR